MKEACILSDSGRGTTVVTDNRSVGAWAYGSEEGLRTNSLRGKFGGVGTVCILNW